MGRIRRGSKNRCYAEQRTGQDAPTTPYRRRCLEGSTEGGLIVDGRHSFSMDLPLFGRRGCRKMNASGMGRSPLLP